MTGAAATLKPFVWLALFAFLVGFFGYLAAMPAGHASARPEPELASGPASAAWNLPRHI